VIKLGRKNVLEPPKTPPRGRRKIGKGWTNIKIVNQNKILILLAKSPLSFTKLREKTNLSPMGLTRHLRELENLGYIKRTRINNKRVYAIQEIPTVEELIIEALVNHLGQFTAIRLLEARVGGQKKVRIEEFYDVKGFLDKYIEKNFPYFRDVNSEALLEAFKNKYA